MFLFPVNPKLAKVGYDEGIAVNILQFSLTLNNNRINESFSIFWHDGTCFE
jgi:hypothetical protein